MGKQVELLIAGATYFGIGYASVHPDCLILEPSQILGGDFHKGMRTAVTAGLGEQEANTVLGKLMKEYGVWEKDKFDILKAAPALHEYVSRTENLHLLLNVKILSIEHTDGAYGVEYISNSGIHHIRCKRILDTTVLRDTYPSGARCISKTLNLFTLCRSEGFEDKLKSACPECVTEDGVNPGEKIVRLPFHPQETLLHAYETIVERWKKAFPDGEEKILFVAEDFEYDCVRANDDPAPCIWSGRKFSNPLTAFVKGMEVGKHDLF